MTQSNTCTKSFTNLWCRNVF